MRTLKLFAFYVPVILLGYMPVKNVAAEIKNKAINDAFSICRSWVSSSDDDHQVPENWRPVMRDLEFQGNLESFYLSSDFPLFISTQLEKLGIFDVFDEPKKSCKVRFVDTSTGSFSTWIKGEIDVGDTWDALQPLPKQAIETQLREISDEYKNSPNYVLILESTESVFKMYQSCDPNYSETIEITNKPFVISGNNLVASDDWSLVISRDDEAPKAGSPVSDELANCQ